MVQKVQIVHNTNQSDCLSLQSLSSDQHIYFSFSGTMLVKTNRIARIFSRKLMKAGRVRFLATEWQYIMIVCIILTEIMTCLLWVLAFDSPQIELQQDIGGKYRVITCSYTKGTQGLVMWGTFNFGKSVE